MEAAPGRRDLSGSDATPRFLYGKASVARVVTTAELLLDGVGAVINQSRRF